MLMLPTAVTCLTLQTALGAVAGPNVRRPADPLAEVGVTRGDVFVARLELGDDRVRVTVPIGGVERELILDGVSYRAESFQAWAAREGGVLEAIEVDDPKTYQGWVNGLADTRVAASVIDGTLHAYILDGGQTWAVQPSTDGRHVSYNVQDVIAMEAFCGVDEGFEMGPKLGDEYENTANGEICVPAGLSAFDTDHEFFLWSGGEQETIDQIELIMNATNVIYERDIPSSHLLGEMIIRTTPDDPYSGDIFSRLDQLQSHWNNQQGGVERHLAHLFSGGDWNGVIGVAYVGVPCLFPEWSYGVSISNFSNNFAFRVGLTAHELGHNWNSGHCNGDSDCGIMCSGIGGCPGDVNEFGDFAQNAIRGWVTGNALCLDEKCVDSDPPAGGIVFGNTLSGEIGGVDAAGSFIPGTIPGFDVDGMAFDRNRATYYLTDTRDGATLYTMRQLDFRIQEVGPLVGASRIAGLAFDPNNDVLYGIDQAIGQLYSIRAEMQDGELVAMATPIGPENGGLMGGLGFDEDQGILYGVNDLTGSTLYSIDTNSGVWTLIGDMDLDDCDGLCWRPSDQLLYTIDGRSQKLYTVDANNGVTEEQTEFRGFGIGTTFGMAVGDERCLADVDGDGELDADDFFGYLDLFASGDPGADLTGSGDPDDPGYGVPDGEIDADDFFYFLDAFVQGCD